MSTFLPSSSKQTSYTTIGIVGAGISGIAAAGHIRKKYGTKFLSEEVTIFERATDIGGTWWVNKYPGCGVDIPAPYYQFSFAPDTSKGEFWPSRADILEYLEGTSAKLHITDRVQFNTECEKVEWDQDNARWRLYLRRVVAGREEVHFTHECKILFTAVGGVLAVPNEFSCRGIESFQGEIFHSARWKEGAVTEGKDVVIIGNGTSAAQIIPAIAGTTRSTTQFARSQHWYMQRARPLFFYSRRLYQFMVAYFFRYFPVAWTVFRLAVIGAHELVFLSMKNTSWLGRKLLKVLESENLKFMRKQTPREYWDMVIPNYPLGCKRRILDAPNGYLSTLNLPNVTLTTDPISHITAKHVHTTTGGSYPADLIVIATGFRPNENLLSQLPTITGRDSVSLASFWAARKQVSAYDTCAVATFPNFFIVGGPNSITGHASVILNSENSALLAINVADEVIRGRKSTVELTEEAGKKWESMMKEGLKETVMDRRSCTAWYFDAEGNNWTTYPFSQIYASWRARWPTWGDWLIR